ncbi:TlpA disulfide reductase family protein [Colwellia sp. MB02u-14]|uniref:TlpA disulfide reductase family protein n=1 Tax=Colwellia sp. MB02u-14 TaxID=2759815 RepID=UPI002175109B|nr:TlpA disulfide reductase family protein [Colwellia sp. MB02u-14]
MMSKKLVTLLCVFITSLCLSNVSFAETTAEKNVLQNFETLISSHKGKVIYVDFWASWCGPCRKSFPWMNNIQDKYQQQGLVIISVNVDNNKALADKFLAEIPSNFTVFYDPKGKVARQYKLKGMPSSYIIDRSGKVVSAHVGFSQSKKTKYEQELIALLNTVN